MDPTRIGIRTRDLAALGVTRPGQLGDDWVRTEHGVHVPAYAIESPEARVIATASALLGDANALGGWAALAVHGVPFFDLRGYGPQVFVHCLPGSQLRARSTIRPFEGLVHPDELTHVGDIGCATIARAAFDEMRMARTVDAAVVVADMATSRVTGGGRTSLAAIGQVIASHHKVRGIVRARAALALACERSGSPWETRLRRFTEALLATRLRVNVPVFDLDGNLLGIADLLDEETGMVLESDGAYHREIDQHRTDNIREELMEDAGLAVGRFTSGDHGDRSALVGRIMQTRARALRSIVRNWTTEPPDWWWTWEPGRRYWPR